MMLTWCDIPGIYWNTSNDQVFELDHVTAKVIHTDSGKALSITNPTPFDARVKILTESDDERRTPLPINIGASFPIVEVRSGEPVQTPLAPSSHQATSQQRSGS